jgi:hypothetical protein
MVFPGKNHKGYLDVGWRWSWKNNDDGFVF